MADSATELLDPPAGHHSPSVGNSAGPLTPAEFPTRGSEQDAAEVASTGADEVLAADLLVEEVSIDGMCGVY